MTEESGLESVIAIQSVPILLAYPTLLLSSNLILDQATESWWRYPVILCIPLSLASMITLAYRYMAPQTKSKENHLLFISIVILLISSQVLGSIRTVALSLVLIINPSWIYLLISLAFDLSGIYQNGNINWIPSTLDDATVYLTIGSYISLYLVRDGLRRFDTLSSSSIIWPPWVVGVISGLVLVWNYEQLHLSMIMVTLACSMVIQITTIENTTTVNYKQGSPTIVALISVLLEILSFKTNFMENRFRAICEVLLIFLSAFIPVDDTLFEELDKVEIHSQSIVRQLFQHEDTKAIFSYLMLNTLFMFVQFLYSFRSKSLGLLSDSLHMALDCTSLALGLVAGVLAKRPPNNSFPFGLSRIETLAGFANGVLLIGIVAGIVIESIERIINPITLERTGELLVVSFLGFVVNIIGIFAFNHGHDHGHSHGHSHSHGSEGEHDNENMKGIFLHILADTLGSAGVVVSTILASVFHTSIFDPIASLFIAVMIFISAIPLVKSSASNLLLSLGDKKEELMRDILSQISTTPGVVGYTTPRFFVSSDIKTCTITTSGVSKSVDIGNHGHEHSHEESHEHLHGHSQDHSHSHDHKRMDEPQSHSHDDHCNDKYTLVGYIHIQYLDGENSTIIKKRVQKIFENSNIHATIQVESESSTCWCRKSQ